MFQGITEQRILNMSSEEKRWFDNIKKAFYNSDISIKTKIMEDKCLEELFKAIDTAKTLRLSLLGHKINNKNNKQKFIDFLGLEIPSIKKQEPKIAIKSEKGYYEYHLGEVIYAIRCYIHENENLNAAEIDHYPILLDWGKPSYDLFGVVGGGKIILNARSLALILREKIAKFITFIESVFTVRDQGYFNLTIKPEICSIKPKKIK